MGFSAIASSATLGFDLAADGLQGSQVGHGKTFLPLDGYPVLLLYSLEATETEVGDYASIALHLLAERLKTDGNASSSQWVQRSMP